MPLIAIVSEPASKETALGPLGQRGVGSDLGWQALKEVASQRARHAPFLFFSADLLGPSLRSESGESHPTRLHA